VQFDVVVAADRDWGIGKTNALPWPRLKGDLAHFRQVTSTAAEGKRNAIVMGRKTWESAEVAGRPLPRRLNVVVSRRTDLAVPEGVIAARSLDAGLEAASSADDIDQVFVVGGAEIFREALVHKGEGDVSVGNVLGSNVFDLLVALPAGILIAGAAPIDFGVAAPLMAVLTFATIVLFAMMRTGLSLGRGECSVLLVLYVAFVVWLVLETTGILHWLGQPVG